MDESFQHRFAVGVGENNSRHLPSIHLSGRGKDLRAEVLPKKRFRLVFLQNLMGQQVGMDHRTAQLGQHLRDQALAGGNLTRQPDNRLSACFFPSLVRHDLPS